MADGENKTVSVEEYNKAISQMQNWQAKATDYEKRYSGIDPDAVKAKLEDYELLRKERATGNPQEIDKLIKARELEAEMRVKKDYAKKLEELEGMTSKQASELKQLRVTSVVMKEAAEIFHPSALELIESVVTRDCDWSEEGIFVKGEDGKPKTSTQDPRRTMDVKEYLSTLAQKYEACAKPTAIPGGKQSGSKSAPSFNGEKSLAAASKSPDKGKSMFSQMDPKDIAGLFQK